MLQKAFNSPPSQVLFCRSHSHYLVLWSVWLNYRKWLIHHSAWSEWSAPARCLCFCPTNLIHQQKQAQGCTGLLPAQDCAALSLAFTQASATCHRNPGSFVQGAVWAPPSFPSHLWVQIHCSACKWPELVVLDEFFSLVKLTSFRHDLNPKPWNECREGSQQPSRAMYISNPILPTRTFGY